MNQFKCFPKMPRLTREVVITEKIDGTNAQIYINQEGEFFVGSRTRWITPENDNYGFAKWCLDNKDELMLLGEGRHFGENGAPVMCYPLTVALTHFASSEFVICRIRSNSP